jgi:hypothetical protein
MGHAPDERALGGRSAALRCFAREKRGEEPVAREHPMQIPMRASAAANACASSFWLRR